MPLEGFGSPVGVVPTDLTVVVDVQSVEFIQPVWDGLEAEGQRSAEPTTAESQNDRNKQQI